MRLTQIIAKKVIYRNQHHYLSVSFLFTKFWREVEFQKSY